MSTHLRFFWFRSIPPLVLIACLAPNAANAQLEEIVVTAQKREQSIQDVPISLDVLSETTLSRNAIHSMRDLIQVSPSLNYDSSNAPRAQSFGIRGVSTEGASNTVQTSVGFQIDEVGIGRPVEFTAELFDIERIEILRGPQGTLFGKNATAGVVNIVTRGPTEEFEGYFEGEVTEDEEFLIRGAIGGPLTDALRGRIAVAWREQDALVENIHGGPFANGINGRESINIRAKLEVDFSENVQLLLAADWSDWEVAVGNMVKIPTPGQELQNFPLLPGEQFQINQDAQNLSIGDSSGVSGTLSWQLSDAWTLKSITAYREAFNTANFDIDAGRCGPQDSGDPCIGLQGRAAFFTGDNRQPIDIERISEELRLEFTGEASELILGAYYENHEEHAHNHSPSFLFDLFAPGDNVLDAIFDDVTGPSDVKNETISVFGDLTYNLSDTWDVFFGLRYTDESIDLDHRIKRIITGLPVAGPLTEDITYIRADGTTVIIPNVVDTAISVDSRDDVAFPLTRAFSVSQSYDDLSGRLGVRWHPRDNLSLYASVARGYKGPSGDISRRSSADTAIVDPENATSTEVGLKGQFLDDRLNLGVSVFAMTVTDLQQTALIPGTTDTLLFNVGDQSSTGMEVDFTALVTERFTISGSLAFLNSEYDDVVFDCYPGQTAEQGCNVVVDGTTLQSLDGKQTVRSPDLRYRIAGDYVIPLASMPFDFYAQLAWNWTDDQQARFNQDPLTRVSSYERLDMALGIAEKDGRYDISVFGKNLTDDWREGTLSSAGIIGRVFFTPVRDQEAYYGVRARFNF
jgi:iron complex outermembrane receptor protein